MFGADICIMEYFTEQNIELYLERFRSLGPLPGIMLTFLKSFVPPLPTIVIIGATEVSSLFHVLGGCGTRVRGQHEIRRGVKSNPPGEPRASTLYKTQSEPGWVLSRS